MKNIPGDNGKGRTQGHDTHQRWALFGEEPMLAAERVSVRARQYQVYANPSLSIFSLMVITAICALTITLITAVGFFGVHMMLISCWAINLYLAKKLVDEPVRFRFWNQFIWAILMPIVCIFGDPFVFGNFEFGRIVFVEDYGVACYAIVGWQILVMATSWFVPRNLGWLNDCVGGSMIAGGTFAIIVGLLILPLTILSTLMLGLGLPGFTPWFTGWIYLKTGQMHLRQSNESGDSFRLPVFIGFLVACLFGAVAYAISISMDLGINRRTEFLEGF